MFETCVLRGHHISPARFSAPLAGLTHSAFRRLLADFGGYGAIWTEMLATPQLMREDFATSPWLRRRPEEGLVVYQLMVRQGDPLATVLQRMADHGVEAVDLNLACDALSVRKCEAGSALFRNLASLRWVVHEARRHWNGILTAKIRLGSLRQDWRRQLVERLQLFEAAGLDAVIVHPRFFEDKFRRRARLDLLPWIASQTRLPIIANGDLTGPEKITTWSEALRPAVALMVGRMAVAQPWMLARWPNPPTVDPREVWERFVAYVMEDCGEDYSLRRIKLFAKYYSANFAFGHRFRVRIGHAASLEGIRAIAEDFFSRSPEFLPNPTLTNL